MALFLVRVTFHAPTNGLEQAGVPNQEQRQDMRAGLPYSHSIVPGGLLV
ncbi:hypothetical protein CP97_05435 [Aurantiacibacter atlanticus]|uniref:Uncharacterized protein n=1 Tax=Aurantiacibacter atlanticus TaxID=1648404 RepID=A0A0H4VAW6_9SPHN|nr:hypothetical protein CP97_05435 [Aurantiacibacter atlanticus]